MASDRVSSSGSCVRSRRGRIRCWAFRPLHPVLATPQIFSLRPQYWSAFRPSSRGERYRQPLHSRCGVCQAGDRERAGHNDSGHAYWCSDGASAYSGATHRAGPPKSARPRPPTISPITAVRGHGYPSKVGSNIAPVALIRLKASTTASDTSKATSHPQTRRKFTSSGIRDTSTRSRGTE